jgi:hypothetical protein
MPQSCKQGARDQNNGGAENDRDEGSPQSIQMPDENIDSNTHLSFLFSGFGFVHQPNKTSRWITAVEVVQGCSFWVIGSPLVSWLLMPFSIESGTGNLERQLVLPRPFFENGINGIHTTFSYTCIKIFIPLLLNVDRPMCVRNRQNSSNYSSFR